MIKDIQIKLLKNLLEEITQKYDEILNEKDEKLKEITQKSLKDGLTNVYSRKFLSVFANKFMDKLNSFIVVFLDLDNFKYVNDNFGHEEGDKVLKKVGNILKNSFRSDDFIIRYGGDEFIVIATNVNENMLNRLTKRVEKAFKKYGISISYGTSLYPQEGKSLKDLIFLADQRMYEQKKAKKLNA